MDLYSLLCTCFRRFLLSELKFNKCSIIGRGSQTSMVSESETTVGETESESAANPESISAQDEDEKDFGTIRAYFDEDKHFNNKYEGVIILIIGKMYDHIVKLYGGGGERQPEYEKVLRTIKAFYSSNDKYDCELIKKAEMTLTRIATGKTNTETEGLTLIIMDDYYDWDYQDLRALWALLDHVVKMDEGNCSSHYKSLFSFIYNTIYEAEWTRDVVDWRRKRVEVVVRMLGAIENSKRKGAREEEVIVDNATTDDESAASPESILAQDEDEKDFGTIRAFFDEDKHLDDGVIIVIIGKMYDHMLKLYGGGGEHQPEYEKLLRTIRAFYSLNDEDDFPYHPRELTEKAEMTLMRIATGKTNTETEGLTLIIMDMDDYCYDSDYDLPLVKILRALFEHVIEMDEGNCLGHYISIFSFICNTNSKAPEWTRDFVDWRRKRVEVVVRILGAIENRKEKGAREEEVIVDNATTDDGTADVRLPIQPRHSWLKPSEILLKLQNFKISEMSEEIQQKPPSGSLFLYNTKALRFYKKDGYNWKKQKDGKTVTEGHMILKVEGHNKLHCYYAHSIDDDKFQRRTYSLLNKKSSIRLVHYLDVNSEDNDKSENVGREAEDNDALCVRHDSPTREKSDGTSSRTKKRPRRDSDGDDINKENGNQVHFPQNANRVISTNTSSLDDEMVLLSKEVESLPGFERGSDWFVSAMLSFKDKDDKAIFKAMGDRNSKVKLLKRILNL